MTFIDANELQRLNNMTREEQIEYVKRLLHPELMKRIDVLEAALREIRERICQHAMRTGQNWIDERDIIETALRGPR